LVQPTTSPSLAEYLTIGEAAKFLGVSPWTLRNWDRDGRLKSMRHPKNGYRIYRQLDLQAILESQPICDESAGAGAPRFQWSHAGDHEHVVQFYESDDFLADSVASFFAAALRSGEACVLIATPAHRAAVEAALASAGGCDLFAARARGQYVALDAAETLALFMVDGMPDPQRMFELVDTLMRDAAQGRPGMRAFGEMVALLWQDGRATAALQLEQLWQHYCDNEGLPLLCAYPKGLFDAGDSTGIRDVCAAHSALVIA